MSEQKVSVSVEQCIIIKFLAAEGVQRSEILQRLKNSLEKHVSPELESLNGVKPSESGERVENTPHNRRPQTSITPSNIDRANMFIQDKNLLKH